jgi:arginyl-tRNA synthetase
MKQIVANLVNDALKKLPELSEAALNLDLATTVERTRDSSHGDFACNVAMRLAKPARKNPREIAASVVEALGDNDQIAKVEIAGPGFINFHLSPAAFHAELETILDSGAEYGRQKKKDSPKILLEFISANPTGPLHVGHGRLAAYGASVGNLLEAAGFPVHREYYVNDAGRQMDILGASVWLRWLQSNDVSVGFPSGGYRGEYIRDIATEIDTASLRLPSHDDVLNGLPDDAPDGDADTFIDALVAKAKTLQGEEGFDHIRQQALESIRADIEDDLAEFGVTFDLWYSEQSLTKTGRIDAALAVLKERGMLYEKDGATWFPASRFGEDKDRVVIRANGIKNYFESDIA